MTKNIDFLRKTGCFRQKKGSNFFRQTFFFQNGDFKAFFKLFRYSAAYFQTHTHTHTRNYQNFQDFGLVEIFRGGPGFGPAQHLPRKP